MQYSVKIDSFEGPLDLLLHLINKMEIEITEIPVAEITQQYMLYIRTMAEIELDLASEYLVMAATLLAIKSRKLLPVSDEMEEMDEFGDPIEDPLEVLKQQLIEYKKFKEAATDFKGLETERSLLFTKAPMDLSEFAKDIPSLPENFDITVYDMLAAFQKLLRRQKLQKPLQTTVSRQEMSVDDRMIEVVNQLRNHGEKKMLFAQLFKRFDKGHLVVTFLSILELMKLNQIYCVQKSNLEDIEIYLKDEDM